MEQSFLVTSSPHIRTKENTSRMMLDVILALVPAVIASIYFFGFRAALVIGITIVFAVLTETVTNRIMKKADTIHDLSAVVTGLLLGLNLSSEIPLWIPAVGAVFAIFIVKQVFGGIGQNYMNPALAARVFLAISYTKAMGTFVTPMTDTISQATPLALIKAGTFDQLPDLSQMFFGQISGSLGETSALAILLGGLYLIVKKVIDWKIPIIYIFTTFVLTYLFYSFSLTTAVYGVLSGGLLLGAFFMATDFVTHPVTPLGRGIFAIGCGLLTVLIRRFGAYPEGVMFAILLMNAFTPFIEKMTAPRVFGGKR